MLPVSNEGFEKVTPPSIEQKGTIYKFFNPNNCSIEEPLSCPKPKSCLIEDSSLLTNGYNIQVKRKNAPAHSTRWIFYHPIANYSTHPI